MPHFFADPSFWVAVSTVIFFSFLYVKTKSIVIKGLDDKIYSIKQKLDEAQSLKDEAQRLYSEAEKSLAQSKVRAKEIIKRAEEESNNIIENSRAKLESDIEIRKKIAEEKIKTFESTALRGLKNQMANMTIDLVNNVVSRKIDSSTSEDLIDSSIARLDKVA